MQYQLAVIAEFAHLRTPPTFKNKIEGEVFLTKLIVINPLDTLNTKQESQHE